MNSFLLLSLLACDLDGLTDMFGDANIRAEQADAIAVVEQAKKDRAADLKVQLDQAGQRVARAVDLKKEVEKLPRTERND